MRERSDRYAWFIAIGAVLFSLGLIIFSYKVPKRAGDLISTSITVVPSDSRSLDCSGDLQFGSARCNFDAKGRRQSAQNPLRPYMTVRRETIILTGVFENPQVDGWLKRALRTRINARVTINCQATLLGILTSVAVRWKKLDLWRIVRDIPVARVHDCQVESQHHSIRPQSAK